MEPHETAQYGTFRTGAPLENARTGKPSDRAEGAPRSRFFAGLTPYAQRAMERIGAIADDRLIQPGIIC